MCKILIELDSTGILQITNHNKKKQARDGRQLASSSQTSTIEGDIIIRDQTSGNRAGLSAPLADPDRLWPGGVEQYHQYVLSILF